MELIDMSLDVILLREPHGNNRVEVIDIALPAVPRVGDYIAYRSHTGECRDAKVTSVTWDSEAVAGEYFVLLVAERGD